MRLRPSIARSIRRAGGALALGWALFALATESRAALEYRQNMPHNLAPGSWRFGMTPSGRLERCLAGVTPLLPRGAVVEFDSTDGGEGSRFFRWRWASYLAPELNLAPPGEVNADAAASYTIGYHVVPQTPPHSHLDFSRQLDGCQLYRVVRP